MNIDETFKRFKSINTVLSIEEERALLYRYVFSTNKLEGNKLTLSQTIQLLSSNTISGNNIRISDILEHKGMLKALVRIFRALRNKEHLSVSLIKEINWMVIGSLWEDYSFYFDEKSKGQIYGEFKNSQNLIKITQGNKELQRKDPLSSPENAHQNMENLVNAINQSNDDIFDKSAFLAEQLWLHKPFLDGNKRTSRLLINFLTMKMGYPLFIFEDINGDYNTLLIEQYLENKPGLILNYIKDQVNLTMLDYITLNGGRFI